MSNRLAIPNRIAAFAPIAALVVMVVMARWLPNSVRADATSQQRLNQIEETFKGLPFFIGDAWVGEDLADLIAEEAQDMLRPTAVFNRRYERSAELFVHVIAVHCSDARDMIGHYPPICYPSSGWVESEILDPPIDAVTVRGATLPVYEYRFGAKMGDGQFVEIRILNAFVLPDGTVTRDIDDINRQSERLEVSVKGVAQLQVITRADVDSHEAREAAGEVLSGLGDMFDVLGVTEGADRDV